MESHPLDFEKPIFELQRRLQDLKDHSDEHDVDLDSAVEAIEAKIRETRREVYSNLSAWQRVQIARHVQRPFALDYIERCFTNWIELRGDRLYADDKAMPSGLAMLGAQRCVVLTHQKGRDTKENVMRNFGCAYPEGYRKALRLMRLAEKFGMPVISLIDTPGAFPGIGSEERHISEAIAVNLREMMNLRVPTIAAVIGEGGSGGALGIGVADRVLILENAYYSVISPEACSAILWRDRRHAAEAAELAGHRVQARSKHGLAQQAEQSGRARRHQNLFRGHPMVRSQFPAQLRAIVIGIRVRSGQRRLHRFHRTGRRTKRILVGIEFDEPGMRYRGN